MYAIRTTGAYERQIRGSRFICALGRVETEQQAQAFVADRRQEHREATHTCTAYVLDGGRVTRSNDDGEPAGAAGVPMLDALLRREITDVVAVVTRYFGGVKLGASGLTRAYRQAVNDAVDRVGLVVRRPAVVVTVAVDHSLAGRLASDLHVSGHATTATHYGERAEFDVLVPAAELDAFDSWVAAATAGQADTDAGEPTYLDAEP